MILQLFFFSSCPSKIIKIIYSDIKKKTFKTLEMNELNILFLNASLSHIHDNNTSISYNVRIYFQCNPNSLYLVIGKLL